MNEKSNLYVRYIYPDLTDKLDFQYYLVSMLPLDRREMGYMDQVSQHIFGFDIHNRIGSLDLEHIRVCIQLWYLDLGSIHSCSDKLDFPMDLGCKLYLGHMGKDCKDSLALGVVFYISYTEL